MSARDCSVFDITCGLAMTLLLVEAMARSAAWDWAWLVIAVVSGKAFTWDTVWAISADDSWSNGLATVPATDESVADTGVLELIVACRLCSTSANMTARTRAFAATRLTRQKRLFLRARVDRARSDRLDSLAGRDECRGTAKRVVIDEEEGLLILALRTSF